MLKGLQYDIDKLEWENEDRWRDRINEMIDS